MATHKNWYLVAYDIRSPQRWRKVHTLIQGYGEPLQLSIFRCWLSQRDREKLRCQLAAILRPEDDLLIVGICDRCFLRLQRCNPDLSWPREPEQFSFL